MLYNAARATELCRDLTFRRIEGTSEPLRLEFVNWSRAVA
jgi:hypothetical protein